MICAGVSDILYPDGTFSIVLPKCVIHQFVQIFFKIVLDECSKICVKLDMGAKP